MAQNKRRKKRKVFSPIYLTLVLIILYLPILMVIIYSFNSGRTIGSWQGFTTSWYSRLFSNALMADALKNSLVLAVVSSLLAGGIGTLGAIGLARSHLKLGGAVETLATLPMMIPELVLGMAYLSVFTAVGFKLGMGALVLTHTTFCIPYVFLNVKSRLVGMDPALFDAARDLGASPARVVRDITLPLCRPAILSGAFLALAMSLDDFVISFFVYGAGEGTLPIKIYSSVKVGVSPQVNALCTLIMGVVFIAVALSRYLSSVRAARQRRLERQARA